MSYHSLTPNLLCKPRHLPTSRIIPSSGPLIPPNTLQQRLTPLLFECSRLLSIVPAVIGTLYNILLFCNPPESNHLDTDRRLPERIDFFVSALWVSFTLCWRSDVLKCFPSGGPHRLPMSTINNWSPHSLALILPSTADPHPTDRAPSYLLASHTLYAHHSRTRKTSSDRLGRRGHDDVRESQRPDLGDEQLVVGTSEERRGRRRRRR
jgi:hypothetical protein